jgi:hypothetical protein
MTAIDYVELCQRLLGLMQLGCTLESADGHIWINQYEKDEGATLESILKANNIMLNNKIYGGVIEALDTIDECLSMSKNHLSWDKGKYNLFQRGEIQFLGDRFGPDKSRIDTTKDGKGGLY